MYLKYYKLKILRNSLNEKMNTLLIMYSSAHLLLHISGRKTNTSGIKNLKIALEKGKNLIFQDPQ